MAAEITADLVNRITEELKSNDYKLIPSPVTILNKLADAQEYLCTHCKAIKKQWDIGLKSDVFGYPFDDSIVNVHRVRYNDNSFTQYEIIRKDIYSFSDTIAISGDTGNQMSELVINGASFNNTSNGILYWYLKDGILEIRKNDDSNDSSVVLRSDISNLTFPVKVLLEEYNSSRLTGSVYMTGKANDTDQTNNKFTFTITTSKRTFKISDKIKINETDKLTIVTFVKPKQNERISDEVDPIIDPTLNKYLVKLVLAEYRDEVPAFADKKQIKLEAEEDIVILNNDDLGSVKKSKRNKLFF